MDLVLNRIFPYGDIRRNNTSHCPYEYKDRRCESIDVQHDCTICWENFFQEQENGSKPQECKKKQDKTTTSQVTEQKIDKKEGEGKADTKENKHNKKQCVKRSSKSTKGRKRNSLYN